MIAAALIKKFVADEKDRLEEGQRIKPSWNLTMPKLFAYQDDDVAMMIGFEKNKKLHGGINANAMGLGKSGRQCYCC